MRRALLVLCLVIAPPMALAASGQNAVYSANCALCHQVGREGLIGQFPRLAGRVEPLAGSPAGRRFLAAVLLNGMSGKVVADGKSIIGVMPPFAMLSDADLASVLTYVTRPNSGKGAPGFTAKQVSAERKAGPMSVAQIHALRAELVKSGMLAE